ncbi:unnamed protein product [Tetraodon nigroviridis]|uniref:(spotted green pufferfish) hypothetical protein n=1 Tax=Tetraodon nigroviridis TaxID=99883 RepID=Q4S900_TETNG|nr:unnamed protein product [Tetraodon nigroviridis]
MADGMAASQTGLPYCSDKRTGRRDRNAAHTQHYQSNKDSRGRKCTARDSRVQKSISFA